MTSQIARALGSDPCVSRCFIGVFPCDKLPVRVEYPCALVANTDESDEKGEHWVAYFFDSNLSADYFDSYGNPPYNNYLLKFLTDNCKQYNCNNIQLQGFGSEVCGQYCISFLAHRARGVSMDVFAENYRGQGPGDKDNSMAATINRNFNIAPEHQTGGRRGVICEQCCCSKTNCKAHRQIMCCVTEKSAMKKKKNR